MKRKKKIEKHVIKCHECRTQADCCRMGAWIDLEEAKAIASAGIKGDFFHLEKDSDFPSGFCVGTSFEDEPCSFLDPDGLCRVHKLDYNLKPKTCIEFPYENNKLSDFVDVLCTLFIAKNKKRSRVRSS
ncbi:MAG: YkgJ family cysteine cluster protein [Candidatus Omnitrophica bacterium]|nr:YkgJ family cysteine cluster protein [Candidatus Omnitrophota bacterium]